MNAKHWVKRMTAASVAASCVLGGAVAWGQAPAAPSTPAATPAAVPSAAPAQPADDGQIATVNGKPINVRSYYEVLVEKEGMQVFLNDFLDLDLVEQACVTAGGIPLQGQAFKDLVDAERARTIASLGGPGLTDEERNQILGKALQAKGVTYREFDMGVEKNALLRALSKGKVKPPTPTEIQDMFDAEFGPKAKMLVLTVKPGTEGAAQAQAVRDLLAKGVAIRTAAASQGIPLGELTIPKNNADPEPYSTFKNWAYGLAKDDHEKKAGDLSYMLEYTPKAGATAHYLAYIEEMIPPQDKLLSDPKVKAQVTQDVENAKETQWMNNQMNIMRANASVDFHNPILKQQWEYVIKQREAAAAAEKSAVPAAPATTAPASVVPAPVK